MALASKKLNNREETLKLEDTKPPIQDICGKRNSKEDYSSSKLSITSNRSLLSSPIAQIDGSPPASTQLLNRYQPSKAFITKCRSELEILLESINEDYHNEIKALNNDEVHANLFVYIGEDFRKPLHKCVLASRAYRLYTTLRTFKLQEFPIEEDIIISDFQKEIDDPEKVENQIALKHQDSYELKTDDIESNELHCVLPEDLVSPDLFLNFTRRIYLNQDISEEETELNTRLVNWIKANKPELIRTPVKYCPGYRESFRTVQPDLDESEQYIHTNMSSPLSRTTDSHENNIDDSEEVSQPTSVRDVSLTGSLLTRTETFEMLPKNSDNGSPVCKNISTSAQDSACSGDASSDKDSTPPVTYAPTTRTGLKPKTFTTPPEMRTATRSIERGQDKQNRSIKTDMHINSPRNKQTSKPEVASKQATNKTSTSKSSSVTSSEVASETSKSSKDKNSLSAVAPSKPKHAQITRAQPISIERSQSPNVLKGTAKNFIATNKKLVSKAEKKVPIQAVQTIDDSEIEVSDSSSFITEPINTDNLSANLDKFTLVSCSKLADDLSKLFINETLSDAIILAKDGKQIRAHKCILSARSAYLAELINKDISTSKELESPTDDSKQQQIQIDLSEFSYSAVYFSTIHLYSGAVKIPDDLDLTELAKLTHLLHISTLIQVCRHNLLMDYCHFFHKPCNICTVGVLKTLPLAWRYDYTDLYSKCLQWIGSHFATIFCLKEFAELKPNDLIEECYKATLSQLTPENIIPKTIECQKLLNNLPWVKWTEPIICLVGRQLEDFCHYVADNYEKILQSVSFMNLSKSCWECEVLEENLLAAMNHLKPESGCKTLIQLHKIECLNESYCLNESQKVSDSFASLISKMRKYCERYLLKEAAGVVHCNSWRHMSPSLQKRIKDQALISTDFDEPTKQLAAKPKLPSMSRPSNQQQQQLQAQSGISPIANEGTRSPSNRSTPESRLKSPSTTYLPPPKNKPAAARHVKVLK